MEGLQVGYLAKKIFSNTLLKLLKTKSEGNKFQIKLPISTIEKNSINTRITFAKFKTRITSHGGTCI